MTARKIRFIEPMGSAARIMSPWLNRWPLLGTVTLGSILAEKGFDVAIYNENITDSVLDDPQVLSDLCSADVVGISIMTPTAVRGYHIADRLRKIGFSGTIAFGGAHASFVPNEAIQHADVVVCGEGETVVEDLAAGRLSGIVRAEPLADLDQLPPLDHFLIHGMEALTVRWPQVVYELPVMTSRGCPHGCTYCSVTRLFGGKVRRQSVQKVCSDMDVYQRRGFGRFIFYDDNFTADRQWSHQLMSRLVGRGIRFNAQTRIDFHWIDGDRKSLDVPLLQAMQAAGGDILYIGYETIDDTTASGWKKGYRGAQTLRQRLAQDTRILHDYGFWIHGMFVLAPEHGSQIADGIVEFARRNHLESLQVAALTPFPGTPLFEQMRNQLLFTQFPSDWDYYDGGHCVYRQSQMGFENYQLKLLDMYKRFYRWGGCSLRRSKALLAEPVGLRLKLRRVWDNAKIARRTIAACRADVEEFLLTARQRFAQPADALPA